MPKPFEPADQTGTLAEIPPEVHLSQYWAVILKRRGIVSLCVGIALAVAALSSFLSQPLYRAVVILEVEKESGGPLDIASATHIYETYDPEFLPTQIRRIKSREVAERVVERLSLAQSTQQLETPKGGTRSNRAREATVRVALGIQGNMQVVPVRGTKLVEVSYIASSPKLAADIANAIAEAYVEWRSEAKFRSVGQASHFLSVQIEQLKGELDSKEQELLAYAKQKDIVSTDSQANVTIQKLEALNREYAAAIADRVAKEARFHEVRTARPDALADTLSHGLVSQLRNDQARLDRDYAEKIELFKPEWPAIRQLKAQIGKGRQHLNSVIHEIIAKEKKAAESDYLTALRREESLRDVLQSQKSEAMLLKSDAVEYNNLTAEVETKRNLLDTLLKRQSETELMLHLRGVRESNASIVERAIPPGYRFKPSYKRNGLMAVLFGCAFGIGLAFFVEYMDRSLRGAEQVEQYLRLPALGIIPAVGGLTGKSYGDRSRNGPKRHQKNRKGLVPADRKLSVEVLPHEHPLSGVAEAYRAFRTALLLSRAGGVRSIVITSGFRQEGKTCTAVNLAIVLGQLGKRVLLVDADLHAPRIHEILRLSNRLGLVSILAENVGPVETIVKTHLPGVSVVPAGPSSPNPSGLLSSEAMSKFLEFARENFDYILLDTPPVFPVADAIVLGYQADGVVVCVRGGRTPREQVARVRDKLLQSRVRILGVLINNLQQKARSYGQPYSDYAYAGETRRVSESSGTHAARNA